MRHSSRTRNELDAIILHKHPSFPSFTGGCRLPDDSIPYI